MKEVSVVVCTRNEEKVIEACLKALKSQNLKPEIIIVDGHSTDKTESIAKKYADKIVYDNGQGISDARNVGARAASGKIVAYCDADCIPKKDWVKNIVKAISGKVVAVSGPLTAIDGGLKQKLGFKIWADLAPRILAKFGYNCLWGANMAIERKTLLANPFRTRFLEDYEMGSRLRKFGGVRFLKSISMPASTRRFSQSFYRTCIKYYILGAAKIKLKIEDRGYYK
ncbi:MAG TPA: glycosyltransferase family A protein [archaeon]|nr:glycosyltransferase family A protein [archaeon]